MAAKGVGGADRKERKITSNSISATFQIFWEDQVIAYLAGDIDQVGLDDLLDHKITFEAPVLVFPHHGGNNEGYDNVSFSKQLCTLAVANTVIFSIGRNKHNNPRPEIVAAVKSVIGDLRISCTQLSKNCAKDLPSVISTHLLPVFSRGRQKNECCGGTFVIRLAKKLELLPDLKSHKDFIEKYAPTALCN